MQRKFNKKRYLIAFVLTLVIFACGILFGIMIEDARLNYSEQVILNEKASLRSLQLQQNYIDSGLADCNTLNQILETNIDELGRKMDEVIGYERNALFNQEEFNLQLQDYFLTEIQFLITAKEIDKKCGRKNVKIVYFYDENELDTQGNILDYLKKLFNNKVLIFSLNSNFKQEPMINILLTSYNIKQFPSVVIEDNVYQGYQTVEQLMEVICAEFSEMKDQPQECKEFKQTKNKLKMSLTNP